MRCLGGRGAGVPHAPDDRAREGAKLTDHLGDEHDQVRRGRGAGRGKARKARRRGRSGPTMPGFGPKQPAARPPRIVRQGLV